MTRVALGLLCFGLLCFVQISSAQRTPGIVPRVKAAATAGDFATAQRELDAYKAAQGVTPEYIEAFSWVGRGQLAAGHYEAATENAAAVRKLVDAELRHRKLDAEPHLPIAIGAAIEVDANALAKQGQRDQAVVLLTTEIKKWHDTSIVMRLTKNLNLLTLEGKPSPELDVTQSIGDVKPLTLAAHKGHPVLLFLWAHWCPDCKQEVEIVHKLEAAYGAKGLVVIAPTQYYGYIAGGKDATPAVEKQYISDVFTQYYSALGRVEIPLSQTNFERFGVSTTPTMVLIDGKGIVRLYNPGAANYDVLAKRIEPLLVVTSAAR